MATTLDVMLSISTTTRAPRVGEIDGREYHFVSREEFNSRIAADMFIEHAEFNGNLYGTGKENITTAAAGSKDVIFDIDVEGVKQLKKLYGSAVVTIFVFPPNFAELEKRLSGRGTENADVIARRLSIATREVDELRKPGFSDYLLINGDQKEAVINARSIITGERLRISRLSAGQLSNYLDHQAKKPE
jgi:guanylate kinase